MAKGRTDKQVFDRVSEENNSAQEVREGTWFLDADSQMFMATTICEKIVHENGCFSLCQMALGRAKRGHFTKMI